MDDSRRNFDILEKVMLFIFNGVIESSEVPVEWKQEIVKPFHKGGQPKDVLSYNPMSILPSLSFIFEKYLFSVMKNFLNKFNIMSSNQYRFVTGRGTRSTRGFHGPTLLRSRKQPGGMCFIFRCVKSFPYSKPPHSIGQTFQLWLSESFS